MSRKSFQSICDLAGYDDTANNLSSDQESAVYWAESHINRLERAVSVLTGSNPEWRDNVSTVDAGIIERVFCEINKRTM